MDSFDSRLEEDLGALRFDEFGDLDGGPEANGGGGVLVAEDLSKSVDGEVGQVAEFVHNAVGALLAQGEEGTGEIGEGTGPEAGREARPGGLAGRPVLLSDLALRSRFGAGSCLPCGFSAHVLVAWVRPIVSALLALVLPERFRMIRAHGSYRGHCQYVPVSLAFGTKSVLLHGRG